MMKVFSKKLLTAKKEKIEEVNFVFVDEDNGFLTDATGELNLAKGIDYIEPYAFYKAMGYRWRAFNVSGEVNFPNLKEASPYSFYETFYSSNITKALFPNLKTIQKSGLYGIFSRCEYLTEVNLNRLQTLEDNALYWAFQNCTKLATISFPSLTTINNTNAFNNCFSGCTALTEIHFRADAQSVIEGLDQYSDKFGSTNATIYFDL